MRYLTKYFLLTVFIWGIFSGSFVFAVGLNEEQVNTGTTLASARISEVINDSAMLKLIVLDLAENLVGIGWSDREREGAGRDKLMKEAKKISSKYGFDATKGLRLDVTEVGGSAAGDIQGYVVLPNMWLEVVGFKNSARLPVTKFKSGRIIMSFKDLKIFFGEKTECLVDGKEYVYQSGSWFQK